MSAILELEVELLMGIMSGFSPAPPPLPPPTPPLSFPPPPSSPPADLESFSSSGLISRIFLRSATVAGTSINTSHTSGTEVSNSGSDWFQSTRQMLVMMMMCNAQQAHTQWHTRCGATRWRSLPGKQTRHVSRSSDSGAPSTESLTVSVRPGRQHTWRLNLSKHNIRFRLGATQTAWEKLAIWQQLNDY